MQAHHWSKCNYCLLENILWKENAEPSKRNEIQMRVNAKNPYVPLFRKVYEADQREYKKTTFWSQIHAEMEAIDEKVDYDAFAICEIHKEKFLKAAKDMPDQTKSVKKELKENNCLFGNSISALYKLKNGIKDELDFELKWTTEPEGDSTDGIQEILEFSLPHISRLIKAFDSMIQNGFGKRLVTGEIKFESKKSLYVEIMHTFYQFVLQAMKQYD